MYDSWIKGAYRSPADLLADCRLLEQGRLFDASTYRAVAKLPPEVNAAEHYLREGWRRGLEPIGGFEGNFLYPYFRSAGFYGPPAVTFLTLCASGPAYLTQASAESHAVVIRASRLFDAASYARRVRDIAGLDPAMHYLLVGERMGYEPSKDFDPAFYGELYPDIRSAGMNYLYHYIIAGRGEGRHPVSAASKLPFDLTRLDPARETVLLSLHQASRTGAPILGYNIALRLREKYNVVALLLAGGELEQDFRDCCAAVFGPFAYPDWDPVEMDHIVKRVLTSCRISYVIANSIECRLILKSLNLASVPVVTLVHEFSSTVQPTGDMGRALDWTTQMVFSANAVAASARADYPNLANRQIHILPQGRVELPPREADTREQQRLRAAMRPPGSEQALVVLGCGTIIPRKGVDIFLKSAAAVAALSTARPVRFVWIGPAPDAEYLASLSSELRRSARNGNVAIVDEVSDLDPAYDLADVYFLSSRLDPLPNVAVEAALRGLPIVCFGEATGFAELLGADPVTRKNVLPYLDVDAAARAIAALAADDVARADLGATTRRIAEQTFDMDRYVRNVDGLGREAMAMMQQRAEDFKTIATDPMFDPSFFLPFNTSARHGEAIRLYLAQSAALAGGTYPDAHRPSRRPCPGFHPQIYAHENVGKFDPALINPLAHFIRSGKPTGPWRTEVITPLAANTNAARGDQPRVALHAHFHYPELATEFLQKLAVNYSPCDLLLSTTSRYKAWLLRAMTRGYGRGEVEVRVVPNRGRNIGAFLTGFGKDVAGRYDIIGHVHGKRSLFTGDQSLGNTWREFMWQNLLGDLFPMMDTILGRMAKDEKVGLVFPCDPHLSDWDANKEIAEGLAQRMAIKEPLPRFIDFPIGTMFWARTAALKPLFDLKLDWKDYPKEPVGIDGTILHALERLLPFVARQAGYRYATTYVPGMTR